jgi:predicted ArsR family transcriptional regulator
MSRTQRVSTARASAGGVRTNRAIVHLLKQEGPLDATQLAQRLQLSPMAIRLHLYALQGQRLVTYETEPRPVGRPAKRWQLTPAADRLFPEGYAELTQSLLGSIAAAFGKAGLERLIAMRTRAQIAAYRQRMTGQASVATRLRTLAAIRTEEGYMADVRRDAAGGFLFVENHCPICAAAVTCTGLCAGEREVFETVLGDGVSVTRTEHIVAGARRCAYRVSATSRPPASRAPRPRT